MVSSTSVGVSRDKVVEEFTIGEHRDATIFDRSGRDLMDAIVNLGLQRVRRTEELGKTKEIPSSFLEPYHQVIMRQLFQLGSEEASHLHRAASNALSIEATRHSLAQISEASENPHPRVRTLAVTALWCSLSEVPNAWQIEILENSLRDPRAEVRREAVRCILSDINRMESPSIIHSLEQLVADRDLLTSKAARAALERALHPTTAQRYEERIAVQMQRRLDERREKMQNIFALNGEGFPTGPVCLYRDHYSLSLNEFTREK